MFGDRRLLALLRFFGKRLELLLRIVIVGRTRRFWPQNLVFLPARLMLLSVTLVLVVVVTVVRYSIIGLLSIIVATVTTSLRIVET